MNLTVKEKPDWSRTDSGTLVNSNFNDYQQYLQRKKIAESKDAQIGSLQSTINNMQGKIDKLEELIQQLINRDQ